MDSAVFCGWKREAVQPEAPFFAELGERQSAERRADDARHVELDGLQRDGVGHVLFIDQRRDKSLVGRPAEGLRESGDERAAQNMPHANHVQHDQGSEQKRTAHLHVLRGEQELAAVHTVGDHAADERKKKNGDAAEKGVQAQ